MQIRNVHRALIGGVAVALGTLVYLSYNGDPMSPPRGREIPLSSESLVTGSAQPSASLPNFAAIVTQYGPAVVNISVSGMSKVGGWVFPQQNPHDPFSDLIRRFQQQLPQNEAPAHGLGSGFILRPDGLIITNAHVVDGASDITVKLTDKREFNARLLGIDKPTDLALLQIDARGLPTVRIGDPARSGVGDWVLAIGSPFGFENSVTAGIISAKARALPEEGYVPFIQTDVAVNPGNSGGPLFNLQGEVIGINSQIYSRSGGYQGLSFAIPIDIALKIEQQLVRDGKVSRGRLGVSVQSVDQMLADSFGLEKPTGAIVVAVQSDGPAAKAGVHAGDIILALNGQPIQDSTDLPPVVADLKPGTDTRLIIWRDRKQKELTARVSQMEDAANTPEQGELGHNALGLAVRPLTHDESRQLDVPGGLVVEQSVGPAAEAGIQPGDIVLGMNGRPVTNGAQLRELATSTARHIAILIQRGNARLFVPLDLG